MHRSPSKGYRHRLTFVNGSIVTCTDANFISAVAAVLPPNKLGVTAKDLRSISSPKGEGTFVYVPKTRFHGVKRLILWLVLEGGSVSAQGVAIVNVNTLRIISMTTRSLLLSRHGVG